MEQNPTFRRTYAKWYFPARDKFDIKTLVFSTLQTEKYFCLKLNTNDSDLYVFVILNVFFFSVPNRSNWWKTSKFTTGDCEK